MPTDFRGNEINVGDAVFYPRSVGRSVEMQEGVVLEIKAYEDDHLLWNKAFDRELPVDEVNWRYRREPCTSYKYKIQPTRSSRFNRNEFERNYSTGEMDRVSPVWIQIGANVVRAL